MNYIHVRRGRHFYECLVTCLRKKHPSRIIGIYFSSLPFFETLIKNIIYCQTVHVFGQFTYVLVCKNVCQASLPSFLTTVNILFRSMPKQMENVCSTTQHLLSQVGGNSLAQKLRVIAAVKLHLNAS